MGEESADDVLSVSKQKGVQSQSMLRGDEKPEQLEDKIDWEAINEQELFNENGSKILFSDVYQDATTIVIFIRHFLCFVTKEYVEDLAKIPKEALEKAKVRLVIIGCGEVKYMKQFRKDTGYWAEFYTDPSQEMHKLMGCKQVGDMGNISASLHTKSGTLMGILRSASRAMSFPGEWQGDAKQQGGAFVLGPGQNCRFAHLDMRASDHYPINKLLDIVGVENVCFQKDSGIITV